MNSDFVKSSKDRIAKRDFAGIKNITKNNKTSINKDEYIVIVGLLCDILTKAVKGKKEKKINGED